MKQEPEVCLADIVAAVSRELGDSLRTSSARPVTRPAGKDRIADATIALFADGLKRENDVVILISNPDYPHVVREDTDKARAIAAHLDPATRRHIAMPVTSGIHGNQSYAAFARLSTISRNRLVRFVQKTRLSPQIAAWLAELGRQTRIQRTGSEDYTRYFEVPLQSLRDDTGVNTELRDFAGRCLAHVTKTRPGLITVAEHGDFWNGNILFASRLDDFRVIDWRGSRQDGYPCADLLRFCFSLFKIGSRVPKTLLARYAKEMDIETSHLGLYVALSLGYRGMNLDHFPRARYLAHCERIFRFLKANDLTGIGQAADGLVDGIVPSWKMTHRLWRDY